jgi:hypothetical protein
MDHFFEQLKKLSDGLMWRRDRKAEMRVRLVQFIEAKEALKRPIATPARAWSLPVFARVGLAAFLLITIGGGTAFASEGTLPGDTLYPVKILNEEVRSVLAFSAEAKADWEEERAERRLEEASKLAAAGKLDDVTRAQLETKFAAHAERVKEQLAKLESKAQFAAAEGLASQFEAALDAHNRILVRLEEKKDKPRVVALNKSVRSKLEDVQSIRATAESKADNARGEEEDAKSEAESKIVQASSSINDVIAAGGQIALVTPAPAADSRLQENTAQSFGAAVMELTLPAVPVAAPLDQALSLWQQAQEKFKAGEFKAAVKIANQAIRKAKEAKVIRKAEKDLNIKVDSDRNPNSGERSNEEGGGSGRGR